MNSVRLRTSWFGWASCLFALILARPSLGQELPRAKPEEVGVSSTKVEELSKYMRSLVDQGKIAGGVTMMARHGKVIHLEAVGMADREEKRPMQTDAIFRIASMTKPITSVAIMKLYEQGKLGLDDPVSKFIPEFKNPKILVGVDPLETVPAKREITIRDLLTHTSGLGSSYDEAVGPIYEKHGIQAGISCMKTSLDETMRELGRLPLTSHPGEKWVYGISTDVLGRVVEVATGTTVDRFIEDQVCRPLGMRDTYFKVPTEKLPRLVAAYFPGNTSLRKVEKGETLRRKFGAGAITVSSDYCYGESNRYLSGVGGLCSTATDYMRFCQMLLNGGQLGGVRLLREDTAKMMTANQIGGLVMPGVPGKFGFGFAITPDTDDIHSQLRGSYYWMGYWSTSFRMSPRGDWIVITIAQLAWDKATLDWFARYDAIAAEAVTD
jgi:CubicO group peptidase (beta-lactamase class C family)